MRTVRCPACRAEVGIDSDDLGHPVACPLCGDVFTPPAELSEGPAPDDEDELDRPSRRRSRPRRYRTDAEEAEAAVKTPGNGLIWTGIGGAILSVVGGLVVAMIGVAMMMDPNPQPGGSQAEMLIGVGAAYAGIGVPYFLVIAAGGRQLKRLDGGTFLVYAAAILGIATIALHGICWPTTWTGMTFGIWALVTVNKPAVRSVLEAARGE